MIRAITGRSDDTQILLINEEKEEAIVMVEDIIAAMDILSNYYLRVYGEIVGYIRFCKYHVDDRDGYIFKFKLLKNEKINP